MLKDCLEAKPVLETPRLLLRPLTPDDVPDLRRVIGDTSIFDIENSRMGSVGYRLDPELWGRGYTSEALASAVDFIFTHTELDRLQATADVRNTASNRVLEKCGFVHEGTVRRGKMVSTYCDYNIWGMLRENFEAAPKED